MSSRFEIRGLLMCALLSAVFLMYQNCSKLKPVQKTEASSLCSGCGVDVDGNPEPGTADLQSLNRLLQPNLVGNCMQNPEYNACIFWKNPVAQSGQAMASEITFQSDLSGLQTHAIRLAGYDSSGILQNTSFRVFAANTVAQQFQSVATAGGEFKFSYANDDSHKLGQIMAFHWLNLQAKYMKEATGGFFASNRSIDVISFIPDLQNAYWDEEKEEVVIGSTPGGNEFALSAEVYAHEMGHANVTYASGGRVVETVGSFKSVPCGNNGVCCRDANGCSWAINEGLADYHMGILFPDSTEMLETIVDDPSGMRECGVNRAMENNSSFTAAQSYNACTNPYQGEVHLMGRVYASIWWEVRKAAHSADSARGAQEVDRLFTNHLPALEGRDDFITVYDKIIATDQALFAGKYSSSFTSEFAKRGIPVP